MFENDKLHKPVFLTIVCLAPYLLLVFDVFKNDTDLKLLKYLIMVFPALVIIGAAWGIAVYDYTFRNKQDIYKDGADVDMALFNGEKTGGIFFDSSIRDCHKNHGRRLKEKGFARVRNSYYRLYGDNNLQIMAFSKDEDMKKTKVEINVLPLYSRMFEFWINCHMNKPEYWELIDSKNIVLEGKLRGSIKEHVHIAQIIDMFDEIQTAKELYDWRLGVYRKSDAKNHTSLTKIEDIDCMDRWSMYAAARCAERKIQGVF